MVNGVYSMFEEPGSGQNQYTQKIRVQAGSLFLAYTRYSKNWAGAKSVYSNFQDLGRLLVPSVYKILENPGPRAEPVYSKIQGPDRFRVNSVYSLFEEPGPGQNLYTQKFRAQVRLPIRGVYRKLEEPVPGRICILKFSKPRQVPGR